MGDRAFECQLRGWSLTTAEIMYRLPDFHDILQTFIWQDYDLAPKFPSLRRFLDFWTHNLDGKLHSVQVASCELLQAPKWRNAEALLTMH